MIGRLFVLAALIAIALVMNGLSYAAPALDCYDDCNAAVQDCLDNGGCHDTCLHDYWVCKGDCGCGAVCYEQAPQPCVD